MGKIYTIMVLKSCFAVCAEDFFFLLTINLKHKPSRKTFVWWKPVSPPPHLQALQVGTRPFWVEMFREFFCYFLYRMDGVLFQPVHLIVPFSNGWSYFLPLPILPPCKFWKRQILFTLSWDSLPQMAHLCLGMPSGWPVGRHSRGFEGHLVYTLPFPPSLFRACWACRLGFTICIFSGAINLPVYHSVINSRVHLFV